jgi:hypothetical protein
MTPRERFLAVLNGKLPDRVPVALFICDQGHFLSQMCPDVDPQDFETLQLKVIELQRQFGADVFVRQLFGLNDPLSMHMGGLNVSRSTDTWEVRTETIQEDHKRVERSTIRTPKGTLTQEMTTEEIRPGTFLYACTKKPVHTREDLELAIEFEPGMPAGWKEQARQKVRRLKRAAFSAPGRRTGRLTMPRCWSRWKCSTACSSPIRSSTTG